MAGDSARGSQAESNVLADWGFRMSDTEPSE